jgi:hypothetical protein
MDAGWCFEVEAAMAKLNSNAPAPEGAHYELRFQPFVDDGRVYAFPCDLEGHVDIDALSDADRLDYLYARVLVGREFGVPDVQPRHDH